MVACFLCSGAAIFSVVQGCIKTHARSLDTIDGPLNPVAGLEVLDARDTTPGHCSGTGLSSTALVILPQCLKPAMHLSCAAAAVRNA